MAPSGDVYRFTFTGVRGDGTDGIQLGEIELFDPEGAKIAVVEATNPGGEREAANQGPEKLVDGDATTGKWFDDSFTTVGSTNVDLRLASPAVVASYQLTSGGGTVRPAQVRGRRAAARLAPFPRRHASLPSLPPLPPPPPPPAARPHRLEVWDLRPGGAFHLLPRSPPSTRPPTPSRPTTAPAASAPTRRRRRRRRRARPRRRRRARRRRSRPAR